MPCRLPTKRWLARSVLPHSLTSNWKRLPEPVFVPPGHLFVRLPVLLPVRRSAIAPQRSEKTELPPRPALGPHCAPAYHSPAAAPRPPPRSGSPPPARIRRPQKGSSKIQTLLPLPPRGSE